MRPVKLELQAFGPYAGRQEIDFTELGERRFFLIHGPTGSGKTSILDGICFALYSQMSGDGRRGDQMRSQQAAPELPMEVRFTFAVGAEVYRVTRSPAQTVVSRGKEREITPKAELCRLTANTADAAAGQAEGAEEPLASGERRVNDAIKSILGFQAEQFRQVVLIPQGEFRKLLSAGSDEREKILQVLLQVDGLRQIEDALKRKARMLEEKLGQTRQIRATLLEEAQAERLEALRQRLADDLAQSSRWDTQVDHIRVELTRCRAAAEAGRRDLALLQERDAAAAALAALQAKGEEMTALAQRLQRVEAAAALVDIERSARERVTEHKAAQEQAARREQAALQARKDAAAAAETWERERLRGKERDAAAQEVFQLRAVLPLAQKLGALRQEEQTAAQALAAAQGRRDKAEAALRADEEDARRVTQQIEALEPAAAALAGAQAALAAERQAASAVAELEDMDRRQRQLEEDCTHATATWEAAQQAQRAATAMLELQRTRWENAQAAVLAATLAQGQPCPVCGALHHPAPAAAAEAPSREELEQLQAAEQACREAVDKAAANRNDAQQRHAAGDARRQAARQTLGDLAVLTAQQAADRVNRAEQALEQASRAQMALADARAQAKALADRRGIREQEVTQTRAAEAAAQQQLAQAAAEHRAAAAQVPETLRGPEAAQGALDQALRRQAELLAALERAEKQAATAANLAATAEEALRAAIEAQREAANRAAAERAIYLDRLGDSGFADQTDYLEARKQMEARPLWRHTLEEYARQSAAEALRLHRAQEAAQGIALPDLDALTRAEGEAAARYEEALAAQTAAAGRIQQQQRWVQKLAALEEELVALDARYGVLGELSDVANGKNPLRVTLQRFVLGALFDDVTAAATQRLRAMSRGRYALQRAQAPLDKRAAAGLDMEVFDEYTGKSRPVATLSGGESFLASLALALGLADVVQSYSGGIHLETIFIDEGFGTLDPEALDEALKVLLELQGAGRLVGVISHVPELRERIDARLEIRVVDRGSSARFVVG